MSTRGEVIPRALKDRTDNEGAAWGLRLANLNAEEDSDDNSMDGASDAGVEDATADGEKDSASFLLDSNLLKCNFKFKFN
jgi:hypothetical protein